jgi:uncharacterized protein
MKELIMRSGAPAALAAAFAVAASAAAVAAPDAPWGQPAEERAAQRSLPRSSAPLWAVLAHTRIGENAKTGYYTVAFPMDVKALNGQTVTLSGFMLPLDAQRRSRHFLLAKYTPVCAFCPPGEPNEVVEVTVAQGVAVTDRLLTVSGKLTLIDNAEKGLFFRVDGVSAR